VNTPVNLFASLSIDPSWMSRPELSRYVLATRKARRMKLKTLASTIAPGDAGAAAEIEAFELGTGPIARALFEPMVSVLGMDVATVRRLIGDRRREEEEHLDRAILVGRDTLSMRFTPTCGVMVPFPQGLGREEARRHAAEQARKLGARLHLRFGAPEYREVMVFDNHGTLVSEWVIPRFSEYPFALGFAAERVDDGWCG